MERGKGKKRAWVWGTPSDTWKPEFVKTYKKGKDLRIMVWRMFWGSGKRSELYIMDRDFESKKSGYSANSYIEVLDANLPGNYEQDLYFMQDNVPIHTVNKVKQWFEDNGIDTSNWPLYSPDLNPIEHIWKALKERVMEDYLEVWDIKGDSKAELQRMETVLKLAWNDLPDSLFESLVQSMTRRIQAIIQAKGWHTKY